LHELDPEAFTKASINAITQNLDPYTTFLVDDEQHTINILTKGEYGGVGIQLGYRNNTMSVVAPMDGGPAKKAGVMSGDIILKVDDEDVDKISFNGAAAKIRGKKGTKVKLTVKRFGDDDTIEFNLIRSQISVKDVTYSGMLSNKIGYIRLNRFSKNTANEMTGAIAQILNNDANSIIIDLRDNPGGLMDAAISILDMIIDKDKPLVSTKGRAKKSNRTFYSRQNPLVPIDTKIAILINQGSASASEIVAGAVQDLDRGVIIGQKSYGKGLVQSAFQLDDKRAIKITTARYYVPSGRFIQKRDYIDEKFIINNTKEDSVFKTIGGRVVLGNDGITPDSLVKPELMEILSTQYWRNGYFYSFAQQNKYKYSSFDEVKNDNKILIDFQNFIKDKDPIILPGRKDLDNFALKVEKLNSSNIIVKKAIDSLNEFYFNEESILREKESNDILELLHLEFAGLFDGPVGRLKQALKDDKTIQLAILMLANDSLYKDTLKPSRIAKN
jgi:carboxyl-terminal processing protease